MSGIYAFDENLGQSFEDTAAATGIEDGQQPPSDSWADADSYKGTGSSIAQGIMREGIEKTAQKGALVMSVAPILGDKIYSAITGEEETRGQDWYFKNVVDPTTDAIDYFVPDPETTGHSAQVLGSLAGGFSQLAAGGAVNMVSNAFSGTTLDLTKQGVDLDTAMKVGGVQSGATALAFTLLPGYGATLAKQIATGAGINLGTSMVAAEASNRVLDGNGYEQPAEQFNPWDVEARVIDTVMGAAFGGQNHFGMKFSRQQKDALATAANFKSFAMDSAPGRPLSDADFNAHQTNMDMGMQHLLQDKPFDDSMVRDAGFEQKPVRLDADEIRGEFPVHNEVADPVNPAEYAAARYAETAKESGLSDEQAANMAKYHEPDISPVTGRYSDHELLGAVARAAKGDAPYKYVEMDTTRLGKINVRKGANDAADDFIKDTGDALQAIYGDVPVYHRGAGRFAALVPEGFDVEAAQLQAKDALVGITQKHGVDDLDVQMYHGESPVPKGESLDKAIKPAQDKLNASKPEDTSDVAGIEGLKTWADASTGSAREVSRRIEEATGSLRPETSAAESVARDVARSLERQSTAAEVKQPGEFLSPDEYRAKTVAEDAQKNNLSPEQAAHHNKKIIRDELTGAYRGVERTPTVKRVQDFIRETGKPAVFAVADVSNLGGKNLALGQHAADAIFKQYHEIIMDHLNSLGFDVVPFRHGGDETSYIVVGAEESVVREAMAKAAADVQRYANRVGIADLPHKKTFTDDVVGGKAERDTSKDGSGIYVGVKDIGHEMTPREIYDAGDREVDANKYAGKVDVAGETMPLKSDSAKDPMSGYAARPEVQQALTADESITVLDDNGSAVSGREAILQAAAEADNAVSLKEGFKAAALCAMRFTT